MSAGTEGSALVSAGRGTLDACRGEGWVGAPISTFTAVQIVLYFGPRRPSTLEREALTMTLAVLAELPTTFSDRGALRARSRSEFRLI